MISEALVNVTTLRVFRPDRSGPGGDVAGDVEISTDGKAIHAPVNEVIQGPDQTEIVIRGRFWINPSFSGAAVDVRENDFVDYLDRFGVRAERQKIRRVRPWLPGTELDHLVVEVG